MTTRNICWIILKYNKIQKIKRVYWHQLIASGYGLVDNRDGKILKYPQFYVFFFFFFLKSYYKK